MGPPSYIRSVVDRNVVMRYMTVLLIIFMGHAAQDEWDCLILKYGTDSLSRNVGE